MREIKFRGKDLLGKWIYGDLIQENWKGALNTKKKVYMIKKNKRATIVLEDSIGQSTGLHDKNGKEIYEGDIFNLGDNKILYIVEWFDTGLNGRQKGNSSRVGLQYWKSEIEVIGNTTDNPELLEGE